MKMNNKNLLILTLIILFISCSEDFLERHPKHLPVSETFWKTEEDAKMALLGVYSHLYLDPFGSRLRLEVLTDNARSYLQLETEMVQIRQGILHSTSGGIQYAWYRNMYRGIASCNFFLDNIDKVDDFNLKNQFIAEVKFLRAWFYFQLQQTYGGVIIYRTVPTIEESKIKQSTSQEVIDFILEDLNAAIPDLPNVKYSGRIVKNSAHAFKAKVLLFTERWAEAASEANIVIQSKLCSLYPDYRDLFLSKAQSTNPDEILFSTVYALPERWHRGGNDHLLYGTTKPRKELLNSYLCLDGLPTTQSPLFNPDDPYSNRDPRCLQTLNPTGIRIINGVEHTYGSETGIHWNKFVEDNVSYFDRNVEVDDYDIIHLRYADVLLMYAEAQNEINGPDQSVHNAINEVRHRSGMPSVPLDLSVDEMRDIIRLERRIELAGEGHRWFDIKRWKIANEVLSLVDEPGGGIGTLKMLPHQYIWPFPQSEIDLNPNLVQNPGY
ncbi:MAG: RagB/SusD family nutrient uptake outer membrane protein [Fermentimonas sp.]